jgi:peptidyl-prolyl cis-trans isomerase D
MLKNIRKNLRLFMWILVILIVPTFILWGVGSSARSRQGSAYAGLLFGKRISWREYTDSWRACRNQLFLTYGPSYRDLLDQINLDDEAWTRLLLVEEAKQRKIQISDETIQETISQIPAFQKENIFQMALYQNWVQQVLNATPRDFEEELRGTLLIQELREAVTDDVVVNDQAIREEFKRQFGRAKLIVIMKKIAAFENEVKPEQEDLLVWYEKNSSHYQSEGQYNLAFLPFYFSEYEQQVEVSAKELSEEETSQIDLKALINQRSHEEARSASEAIFMELVSADNPQQYIEKAGIKTDQTDWIYENASLEKIGPVYPLIQAAKGLPSDGISDPIATEKGIFIITNLTGYLPPDTLAFEEVKDKVLDQYKSEMANEIARKTMEEKRSQIAEAVAGGASIEEAARISGLKSVETDWLNRSDEIPKLGRDFRLMQKIFELQEETLSPVVETNGHMAFAWVSEFEEINEEKWIAEKDQIAKNLKVREAYVFYNQWVTKLKEEAEITSYVE